MTDKEHKIEEMMRFIRNHPDSFASRTVMRRFGGGDFEVGDDFFMRLQDRMGVADPTEIDLCYDIIK